MEKAVEFSIITVSYNAAATIEQTILSVIRQDYSNIEYIVIDGGSTDGTVDIIRKYEDNIAYWISEPDQGIYDAMNKGIRRATGDYVYFLGADDWLRDDEVMQEVAAFIRRFPGYSFYMGNVFLYAPALGWTKRQKGGRSTEEIKRGKMCPHQGLFTSRGLMRTGFDTKYKIAADYAFLLRHIVCGARFCPMDIDVAYYGLLGSSSGGAMYDEYIELIREYAGDRYLGRMYRLKKTAGIKKWVKKGILAVLGKKIL